MTGCHNVTAPDTVCTISTTVFNRSASLQEQVVRALQTNFLLLHQPAPNAFVILDPNPVSVCQWETVTATVVGYCPTTPKRQRFQVTLGGHSSGCSCFEQPFICPASTRSPCAHILFVLLRVLRLKLEDPRISRPRFENHEVEYLLQRYARLCASNFRLSGSHHAPETPSSTTSTVFNVGQTDQLTTRIVMPRPVVMNSSGPSPSLLTAVSAFIGSSESSELSNITRSIESSASGCKIVSVCRPPSHAFSAGGDCRDCKGGNVRGCDGSGIYDGSAETENVEGVGRRPKTEPQAYHDALNSRLRMLNSRHALSTTFRPIGEPNSNPETDPETEGVSSSSRSSQFEETPQGVLAASTARSGVSLDDTLTGHSRRSTSPESVTIAIATVCRLCLREFRPLPEPSVAFCSSVDCGATYHQECFCIWQEECESETGSLYCSVCGRVWTNALTPTNLPDGWVRGVPSATSLPVASPPQKSVAAWASASGVDDANLLLLQNQIIPGLRSSLAMWKLVFSEEVAMGIISPYWHVRQSALRQVAKITICRVLMARKATTTPISTSSSLQTSEAASTTSNKLGCESLRMSIRLIQYLLGDPADDVFIASLCAFREILGYLICFDTETMNALQRTIAPVLRRLLIFVSGYLTPCHVPINTVANAILPTSITSTAAVAAIVAESEATQIDSSSPPPPDQHRRANLALVTLVELAKGQEGEMSIGRDTSNAEECMSICGLPHLAHFLLRSAKFRQAHLVGRLKLLEKLVQMHRETVTKAKFGYGGGEENGVQDAANKRISYRHLCSSLIFTCRHVFPPEQPVFPHNLASDGAMTTRFRTAASTTDATGSPIKVNGTPTNQVAEEVQISSFACIMEANIKASRLARRVFVVVAQALLQEPPSSSISGTTSLPDAESFVNAQLELLDSGLAAKLRAKLTHLLSTASSTTLSVTVTSPNSINTCDSVVTSIIAPNTAALVESVTTPPQPPPPPNHKVPPAPPPRRFSQTKAPARSPTINTRKITPSCVRIALEPAYDHVALSETAGVYSSSEEEGDGEGGDEEALETLDWEEVGTKQQPQHNRDRGKKELVNNPMSASVPIIPSPAELSALKTALRRAALSPVPLVTIPNLAQALNLKDPLKSDHQYKEGIDWLLGPFLGKGAFSLCYQARDMRTGTLMAVKRLRFVSDSSAEAMEQLATAREEVEIMRHLHHPNVLRLFGIAYNSEKKYVDIFVEWMPGGSITGLLNQYGAFTEPVSLAYILQVIRGISCLHKHGILHRDLKGANLLVDCTGSVVRISDFGASARLGSRGSVAGQFQGQVIGTFAFMAPEVLRGETYGRACDVWSIGCCLLEMLSGKPPWNDSRLTNQYALMFTIASTDQPPSYPKSISPLVKQFLDSCFNRVPEQRPTASRLLRHPVFSTIVSASEPFTDTKSTSKMTNSRSSSLSKSFTTVSLSSSSSRATSRHRALPPVPHESSLQHFIASPLTNYDKLISHHPTSAASNDGHAAHNLPKPMILNKVQTNRI